MLVSVLPMPVERPVQLPKKVAEQAGRLPIYTAGRASIGVPAGEMPVFTGKRGEPRIVAFAQEPTKEEGREEQSGLTKQEQGRLNLLEKYALPLTLGNVRQFGNTPEREQLVEDILAEIKALEEKKQGQ